MKNKINKYRAIERMVKGFANYRRLQILDLLHKKPDLSVQDIADKLNTSYMNTSDHIRKMAIAGLVIKRHNGNNVIHKLTDRGKTILVFCKKLK